MRKKKSYIEWLRVISMCAVILLHIGSIARTDFPDTQYGHWGGVLFQSISYISHFSVPVFLMITGALMLNPEKEITIEKLLKKYVLRYCLVLLIFGWGYAYIELLFSSKRFIPHELWLSFINMLQGKSWGHLWYLYTLIGIMLILPVMRAVTKACTEKEIFYLIVIFFLFTSILPCITKLTGFSLGIVFPISSVYILYILLGYLLDQKNADINNLVFFIIEFFCVSIFVVTTYFNIMKGMNFHFGLFDSPFIVIFSALLFNQMKHINPQETGLIKFLSSVSFGVYITHMIWINFAFKFLKIDPVLPTPLTGIIVALGTLLLSIVLTWILKKLPVLKTIL